MYESENVVFESLALDVHERDLYTFLIYPSTPILSPTEKSLDDIIEDGDGNTHDSDDDSETFDSPVIPYCKDRVLHIMKTIATNVDSANENVFSYDFVTAAMQYKIMTDIFPNLHRHCKETQLQYWVGQAKIWGHIVKSRINGKTIYGRHLWIVRKKMRQFLIETNDSLSLYWQNIRENPHLVCIGYARKSVTKETDVSRSHLLQLMVDKLHFRLKCQEVYVSPCCAANDPILDRDSPSFQTVLASLKSCKGDIADLTDRLYYSQQEVRLILSRHMLLKNNKVEKFNCRSTPVQRSK
ncbi:hypothetical protein CLU79DRAFT_706869 [Phycomyces nitens]|nr:hypothetical protein CLU79DRAFT_706869 [Phycomyces nitens]